MIKEYGGLEKYPSKQAMKKHEAEEAAKKEAAEKTKKQIQDQEMMKEKIRQNKSNDKSSVIKLMRKIVG